MARVYRSRVIIGFDLLPQPARGGQRHAPAQRDPWQPQDALLPIGPELNSSLFLLSEPLQLQLVFVPNEECPGYSASVF